jgi:hypothetical protein
VRCLRRTKRQLPSDESSQLLPHVRRFFKRGGSRRLSNIRSSSTRCAEVLTPTGKRSLSHGRGSVRSEEV